MTVEELMERVGGFCLCKIGASTQSKVAVSALQQKCQRIRLQALKLLLKWIKGYWLDFHTSPRVIDAALQIASSVILDDTRASVLNSELYYAQSIQITEIIRAQKLQHTSMLFRNQRLHHISTSSPTATTIRSTSDFLVVHAVLMGMDAEALAVHLISINHTLFSAVSMDVLAQLLSAHKRATVMECVRNASLHIFFEFSTHQTRLIEWIRATVLSKNTTKKLGECVKHFVKLASALFVRNDFGMTFCLHDSCCCIQGTTACVIFALTTPALLQQLKTTQALKSKYLLSLMEMAQLLGVQSNNFTTYRRYIEAMFTGVGPSVGGEREHASLNGIESKANFFSPLLG